MFLSGAFFWGGLLMSEQIGVAAGKVWQFLRTNGPATSAMIQKGTGVKQALANQAIGWLAREGKLKVADDKRTQKFSLL